MPKKVWLAQDADYADENGISVNKTVVVALLTNGMLLPRNVLATEAEGVIEKAVPISYTLAASKSHLQTIVKRNGLWNEQRSAEWEQDELNTVTGCDRVSNGCDHCYAERMAARLQAMGMGRVRNSWVIEALAEDLFEAPLRWKQPGVVWWLDKERRHPAGGENDAALHQGFLTI